MEYKSIKLEGKEIANYLELLEDRDYIFFYNPEEHKYILGLDRLKGGISEEDFHEYKYVFCSLPFFQEDSRGLWEGMGNENVAFKYYIVMEQEEVTLYFCEGLTLTQIDTKAEKKKHIFYKRVGEFREWEELFKIIMEKIESKEVEKVVASRRVEFHCASEISVKSLILNLLEQNSKSYVFAYCKGEKVFLGATPELLVEKKGKHIRSCALAGTIAKNGIKSSGQGRKLLRDEKNNYEHSIVAEAIAETMKQVTSKVKIENIQLMELKNLYHLKTIIRAEEDTLSLIEWAKLLHPTPAMGGKPREKALDIIKKYEKHQRGMFAAPLGVIDEKGEGCFVVGIRSALIDGNKIYAYAGCGIVQQSDCRKEYEEIDDKLKTILECL